MPTNIPDASGNGAGMILGDPNTSTEVNVNIAKNTAGGGGSSTAVAGDTAHDAADSGNPVKIGGYASNAAPTGVQDGDRVNAWFGRNGQQMVTLQSNTGSAVATAAAGDGDGSGTGLVVNARGQVFNGTTYDRLRGNTTGLFVAGVQPGPRPVLNNGDTAQLQMDTRGNLAVGLYGPNSATSVSTTAPTADNSIVAAAALCVRTFETIFNGTGWDRVTKPNAVARLVSSAATTNATSVKASAGNVMKIIGNNTVGSKRYLKLYDKASAPVVGTDTPVMTLVIPASSAFNFDLNGLGFYFATGIAYAITNAAADADTTAIGAGDIECLNILYTN